MATATDKWPWWTPKYLDIAARGQAVIRSGCSLVGCNINCPPEQMRANAEAQLVKLNWWPAGKTLPLEVYTLARYIQSEVGTSHIHEAVAVGEAAMNRAKIDGKGNVLNVLLYRGGGGNGYYGPIQNMASCGRWAATSADPTIAALMIADLVYSGDSDNFNNGADDQDGLEYANYFPSAENKIRASAAGRNYWVGPLPGVDHFRTTQWKRMPDVAPTSSEGQALIARAVNTFGPAGAMISGSRRSPMHRRSASSHRSRSSRAR